MTGLPDFLRPTIAQVEARIRDHELRADHLASRGKQAAAQAERRKAERLRRKALPRAR